MTTIDRTRNGCVTQIPPIYLGEVLTLELSIKDHTYIKVVATSDTQVGHYTPHAEYWRTGDLADFSRFDRGAALSIKVSSMKWERDEDITTFFDDFKAGMSWSETLPFYGWRQPSYTPLPNLTPYRFQTQDRDVTDRQAPLLMSLLIDKNNNLQGVGWHKTFCPRTGYIWERENGPKSGGEVRFVLLDWTAETWHACPGVPMQSWWYVINLNPDILK